MWRGTLLLIYVHQKRARLKWIFEGVNADFEVGQNNIVLTN